MTEAAHSDTPLALSHPDRVLFPEDGVAKRDLAEYYAKVARWALPHLVGRPLSLLRATDHGAFFQKHPDGGPPAGMGVVTLDMGSGPGESLVVEDERALISLAQLGAVEIHTWGGSLPRPTRADRLTFDLDADPVLPWARVVEATRLVRDLLTELDLRSFLKTSGGKGVHVVAPLTGRLPDWDEAKDVAKRAAWHLARSLPDRFTATTGKAHRKGKIFVDYLRNAEGATTVAALSTRHRAGVPVSLPIAWEELTEARDLRGAEFNLKYVPAILEKRTIDPWSEYGTTKQALTAAAKRRLP